MTKIRIREWFQRNGIRAWIATGVFLIFIIAVADTIYSGYDLSPISFLLLVWTAIGLIAVGVTSIHQRFPQIKILLKLIIGFLIFGYAFVLFGWQVVHWLRFDEWVSLDLLAILTTSSHEGPRSLIPAFFDQNRTPGWLVRPESWFGLHKVVTKLMSWISFVFFILFVGLLVMSESSNRQSNL